MLPFSAAIFAGKLTHNACEREVDQAVKSIFEATSKPIVNTVDLLSNCTVKCEPIEEETSQILFEENAEMEEPCLARKTVSVDSHTPGVILSVLDQIKGEKVAMSQHDEEENEEPVIARTKSLEERYDETHTTTETTKVEAATITILSCSQKIQIDLNVSFLHKPLIYSRYKSRIQM